RVGVVALLGSGRATGSEACVDETIPADGQRTIEIAAGRVTAGIAGLTGTGDAVAATWGLAVVAAGVEIVEIAVVALLGVHRFDDPVPAGLDLTERRAAV